MKPPKASGGRPLCPKNMVDKVQQFVTPCKKNEYAFWFLLSPRLWKYPSQWLLHYAKKNWKPYKPHVTVPLAVARSGRPTGVLWLYITATRGLEEHVIWSGQKLFLLLTSPIKQNKRYWASVSHILTVTCKEQGGGSREVGVAFNLA